MNLSEISAIIGVIAGLLHVFSFVIYNKQLLKGESQPNTSTWILWVYLTVLNCTSYFFMTTDWAKSFLPIASSAAGIATFFVAVFKGKMSKIDPFDAGALVIGLLAGGAWWLYKSATHANLILQISVLLSFIPTYRWVWKNAEREKGLPWYIWTFAYSLSISVVIMRWNGHWQDLAYPINCFFLHLGVGLLSHKSFLKKFRS